jgi:hypothetical protein
MILRWLERRAWRAVLDPRTSARRLARARRTLRRATLVRDAYENSS